MTVSRFVRCFGLALAIGAVSVGAPAQQTQAPNYVPWIGQEGKDVVWVPTAQVLVDTMLEMAKVTPNDYVIDLGSGDGRLVITAAKRGTRALGIEYNPDLVTLAKQNAEREGVANKARFVNADIFQSDFSKATVITMFLLPELNLRLRPTILKLEPGTRVVSNSFGMGDWEPDQTVTLDDSTGCTSYCTAHLWIVPAKVNGKHKVPQGELALVQNYQMVSGTLRADGKTVPVEGKVLGEEILLTVNGRELRGRVKGDRIELRRG